MKKIFIISILIVICGMTAMAQNNPVTNHTSGGNDRKEIIGFDPLGYSVWYDSSSEEIVIGGLQEDISYLLMIAPARTPEVTLIAETIDGINNRVNVSMLDEGRYFVDVRFAVTGGVAFTRFVNIGGSSGFPNGFGTTGIQSLTDDIYTR